MKKILRLGWILTLLLLIPLSFPPRLTAADGVSALDPVPEDTAILEVDAPAGSKITVNGRDYGTQRRFEFRPLKRESAYTYELRMTRLDATRIDRTILARGGQNIRCRLPAVAKEHPEMFLPTGHKGSPGVAAFSPDGRWLVSGGSDGKVVLWDVESGRPIRNLAEHLDSISAVAFDPEGRRVLATDGDGRAFAWEPQTGRRLREFQGTPNEESGLAISPDGRLLLSGDHSGNVFLHDLGKGTTLRTLPGHGKYVTEGAFSPDGRRGLTGSADKTAILWDLDSGRRVFTLRGHRGWVSKLLFRPDGRYIITAAWFDKSNSGKDSGELRLWDATTGTQLRAVETPERINGCALTPDGLTLLTVGGWKGQPLTRWDATTLRPLLRLDAPKTGYAVAVSSDGRIAFDGLNLWDLDSNRRLHSMPSRQIEMSEARFLKGGQKLLVRADRHVDVWDLSESTVLRLTELPPKFEWMTKLRISGNDRTLAAIASSGDGEPYHLVVWDATTGRFLRDFALSNDYSSVLELSEDGRLAVTQEDEKQFDLNLPEASLNGQVFLKIWDVERGKLVHTIARQGLAINAIRFRDGGRQLLLAHLTGIGIVDIASGQTVQTIWAPKPIEQFRAEIAAYGSSRKMDVLNNCNFSPDGELLLARGLELAWASNTATGRNDIVGGAYSTAVWNAETGQMLHNFRDPCSKDEVYNQQVAGSLSVSPDKRILITRKVTGQMVYKDLSTGRSRREYSDAQENWSSDVLFLPDSRHVICTAEDGSCRIVDLATGEELLRLVTIGDAEEGGTVVRGGWLAFTPEGLFDGSEDARRTVAFRIGGGLNLVPLDRFFQDFYRPGLIPEVLRGGRPAPEVTLAKSLPPRVKIVSPDSGSVSGTDAIIEVEAIDQGGGISSLSIFQNGARILAPGESRLDGKILRRTFQVALIEGRNRLRVTASSADGSWEAEPAEIVLEYGRTLPRSRLHLVAVGISKYADANLNLSYAARDARAMAALFRTRGRRLYEEVRITEVLDEKGTRTGVRDALKKAAGETRPQDTLVVFLAGHGTAIGQRYYFVPHELRRQADRMEDDVRAQGLPADELSDDLGAAKALKRMLIIDTCSSGGALGLTVRGRSGFALRGAIERLSRAQGIFTIAAASAGEEAKEAKELGHGVLSYTLLAALNAAEGGPLEGQHVRPSGPDGVVDVLEWFSFAAGQVPRLTEKLYGAAQDVLTSGQGSSFPVLPIEER